MAALVTPHLSAVKHALYDMLCKYAGLGSRKRVNNKGEVTSADEVIRRRVKNTKTPKSYNM